jgi:hypothetical protein
LKQERQEPFDSRTQGAIDELRQRIRQRYPSATFAVTRSQDEPENIHLITTVDLDDPDEVVDLVLDRLIELEVEERIPLYVIPVRTPERILAELKQEGKHDWVRRIHSIVGRNLSPADIDL